MYVKVEKDGKTYLIKRDVFDIWEIEKLLNLIEESGGMSIEIGVQSREHVRPRRHSSRHRESGQFARHPAGFEQ